MDVGVGLLDRVEDVQGADHVVVLGVHGVLAVDHRIRRGALFREMNDRVGTESVDHVEGRVRVRQIGDERVDQPARVLVPGPDARVQRRNGNEALDTHLVVVLPPYEVVTDRDIVATIGQMQRRRPPEVPVAAQNQDPHSGSSTSRPLRCCLG